MREPQLLRVLRYPQDMKMLRTKSAPVTEFDTELRLLVVDMFATMRSVHGLGLAAIQVGVPKQLSVLWLSQAPLVMCNPKLVRRENPTDFLEGCLSIPGASSQVRRYQHIVIEAQDQHGEPFTLEATGSDAHAIQHELDHLDGKLYIDRLKPTRRQAVLVATRRFQPPRELTL